MEYKFPRTIATRYTEEQSADTTKMSTLTMSAPYHHSSSSFHRELSWQNSRPTEYPSRPRQEPEKVALPSIRQAFPELQLRVEHAEAGNLTPSSTTSPTVGPSRTMTPPEYVHSPNTNKRRRLSLEEEREMERANQVPRLYEGPVRPARAQSPPRPMEAWTAPARSSPYLAPGAAHAMRSPTSMEIGGRVDARPTLPSLPSLAAEREDYQVSRARGLSRDDYRPEPPRPSLPHTRGPSLEPSAPAYRSSSFGYGFHHPTRVQSLSVGASHPYDRTPFQPAAYGPHYQDAFMRIGELGMSMNGDNKQRKRRGNLPKETTDKLRAWFVGHLHHPYPTEDEKQELMRQTGLQMNQISNWFINARRRQLPTLINNARVETDAMSGRGSGSDSKILSSTERASEFDRESKRGSVPLSDGEGSNYDDMDLESLKRRRAAATGRGSV